jgi:hypothetical protein
MSEETVTFNLEVNVEKAFSNVRRIELIVFRVLGLWLRICRLLNLPEDSPINRVIEKVQHLTMVIRTLHTAAILLQTASGPIGWAMAGIGLASAAVTSVEFMTSLGE